MRNVTFILHMPVSISFWVSCMLQFNTFLSLSCEEFVRIHHICEELFLIYRNGTKILSRTVELNCAYVHFLGGGGGTWRC